MANIDHYLEDIELASRGEEVRDSIIDAFEALNSEGPGTMDWDNITDTPDTLTGYGVSEVPASMVSGVLALNNIPPSALERMVPVADDTARFALTSSDVQNGDTVKVLSTLKLYLVVDDTSLSTEAGYEEYRAGTADSVDWSGVLNTPDTLAGYGIEDAYTKDEVDDITTSEEVESEAGNPISIETDAAQYAKNTHLTLEPVQDLHGYDHPWAGGVGKNLLPMTLDSLKLINTSGTWSKNSFTQVGITYTVITDASGNVMSINANGTSNSTSIFWLGGVESTAGTYYLCSYMNTPDSDIYIRMSGPGQGVYTHQYINRYAEPYAVNVESNVELWGNIRVGSGKTANNLVFKPYFGKEQLSSFEPYSNICPITGVDEVEVRATGKNLWDRSIENRNGSNCKIGGILSGGVVIPDGSLVLNEGTYTASASDTQNGFYITGEDGQDIKVVYNKSSITFTISKKQACSILLYKNNVDINYWATINVQLELGSTATDYEPYTEYTASLDLPEPVYSGTLDLETGELVADMATVDLGTLTWSYVSNSGNGYFATNGITDIKSGNKILMSDCYNILSVSFDALDVATYLDKSIGWNSGNKIIYAKNTSYSDAATFKTAMSGVQLCYELATPKTYQLTPQQLALFRGINNISTNAKTVQVTYRNGELATIGDIVESTEVAKQNAIGESASYTDARLATELAPILGNFATAETSPTSASHAVGEYLLYNNRLYKVLAAISAGQQLTIGTNVGQTNVAAELASLNNVAVHFISDANEGSGTQSNLIDVITNAMTVNGFYQIKGTYTNHSYGYTAIGWRVSYSNEPRYAGLIICHDGNVIAFSKQGTSTAVIKVLATP